MAKSLSLDLRRRVVDTIERGLSCRQAAERFGVSASSAIRWFDRLAHFRVRFGYTQHDEGSWRILAV